MKEEFSVKQTSIITGVSEHCLRAWERRYGIIAPIRRNDQRRYTYGQIEYLIELRRLMSSGLSIKQACKQLYPSTPAPSHLDPEKVDAMGLTPRDKDDLHDLKSGRLNELIVRYSGSILEDPVTWGSHELSHLVQRIGTWVDLGLLELQYEHAFVTHLRSWLIRQQPFSESPLAFKLGFCTPEGEFHDLGLYFGVYIAKKFGYSPILLGPHMPHDALCHALRDWGLDAVVLVTTARKEGLKSFKNYCQMLNVNKPKSTEIWVAGALAYADHPFSTRFSSFSQFTEKLRLKKETKI